MIRPPWELVAALAVISVTTTWYVLAARSGYPAPGGAVGLTLAIVGFLLMIAAEFLYTLRKRRRDATWGPTRYWLQTHVFMGLVGPWLVLLHSAGHFHGIAGAAAGLTALVVLSGLIGRFLYTSTPRTLDGAIEELQRLESKLAKLERQLPGLGIDPDGPGPWSLATENPPKGWWILLSRRWLVRKKRRHIVESLQRLKLSQESRAKLEPILIDRYRLWLTAHSLVSARQLLAAWQFFHVPLAAVLFVVATAHIAGALYFSALSR